MKEKTTIVINTEDVAKIEGNRSKFIRDAISEKFLRDNPTKEGLSALRINIKTAKQELKNAKFKLAKDISLGETLIQEAKAEVKRLQERMSDLEHRYLSQNMSKVLG